MSSVACATLLDVSSVACATLLDRCDDDVSDDTYLDDGKVVGQGYSLFDYM